MNVKIDNYVSYIKRFTFSNYKLVNVILLDQFNFYCKCIFYLIRELISAPLALSIIKQILFHQLKN
jgi:hypothetical protein